MNFDEKNYVYSAKEVLDEQVTDLTIMREKPLTFKVGGSYLIIAPIMYYEHPAFIRDISNMLLKYKEIFTKVEFLTTITYTDPNAIQDAINQITIMNITRNYKHFITKGVPRFIRKWGKTIDKKAIKEYEKDPLAYVEFIPIEYGQTKKILQHLQVDELLHILLMLWVFNYDIVKKKFLSFIQLLKLDTENIQKYTKQMKTLNKEREPVVMPKFSMEPFSENTWKIFEEQSRMN